VCIIKNGLKQRDALSPLLFTFALKYTIRRVRVKQDGSKLNGKHQLLVYTGDDNILGGSVRTIKNITQGLVVVSKENRLLINATKISTWSCLKAECGAKSQHKNC
jgi:hypothetical protein